VALPAFSITYPPLTSPLCRLVRRFCYPVVTQEAENPHLLRCSTIRAGLRNSRGASMGGSGSGRLRSRDIVEEHISLSLPMLLRNNQLFDASGSRYFGWADGSNRTLLQLTIEMNLDPSPSFFIPELGQRLTLQSTAPHFGGIRWWFSCPGPECGQRRASLYYSPGDNRFLCRDCLGLTYRSCQESHRDDPLLVGIAASMGVTFNDVHLAMKGVPKLHRRPWVRKRDRRPDYKSRWVCPMAPSCRHT